MISPELLRRYTFFANFSHEELVTLAKLAEEKVYKSGEYFFREGEPIDLLFLIIEGGVAVVMQVPDQTGDQQVSKQLTEELVYKDVVVSTVGTGGVFGWSSLLPPYQATAGIQVLSSPCRVVVFNCEKLRRIIELEPVFGKKIIQKTAGIIQERLRDVRMEALGQFV